MAQSFNKDRFSQWAFDYRLLFLDRYWYFYLNLNSLELFKQLSLKDYKWCLAKVQSTNLTCSQAYWEWFDSILKGYQSWVYHQLKVSLIQPNAL